jgi:taurine dioxygenase
MGPVSIPPFAPKYGREPELVVLDQIAPKGEGGDEWHSDNTFMAEPPMGSILKAVQLPTYGGTPASRTCTRPTTRSRPR